MAVIDFGHAHAGKTLFNALYSEWSDQALI